MKSEIKLGVKNPDLNLVMESELDKAQAQLDQQKLIVKVQVEPFWNQVADAAGSMDQSFAQGSGISKGGRPVWDLSGRMNSVVDWGSDFVFGNGPGGDGSTAGPVGNDLYNLQATIAQGHQDVVQKRLKASRTPGTPRIAPPSMPPWV